MHLRLLRRTAVLKKWVSDGSYGSPPLEVEEEITTDTLQWTFDTGIDPNDIPDSEWFDVPVVERKEFTDAANSKV